MNTNNDKQQAKLLQGADFRPKKVPFFFYWKPPDIQVSNMKFGSFLVYQN